MHFVLANSNNNLSHERGEYDKQAGLVRKNITEAVNPRPKPVSTCHKRHDPLDRQDEDAQDAEHRGREE